MPMTPFGGPTTPYSMPSVPKPMAPVMPTMGSNLGGGGGGAPMTQDEVLKLFVQLLSSPEVQQMLAASMQQQGAGMGGMRNTAGSGGFTSEPLSQPGLWGSQPQGGHVQWMGGMPPGYNDKVAKTLSATALGGNVLGGVGGVSGILSGLLGLLGGGKR